MKSKNRNRAFVKSRNLNRSFIEISLISVNRMLGRLDPGDLVRLGGCSNRTYQEFDAGSPETVPTGMVVPPFASSIGVQLSMLLAMPSRAVV